MYPASFLAWLSMCWLCTCLLYPLGAHSNCDPFACCVSLLSIIRICLSSCCLGSSLNYLSSHHHLLMDSVSISVFSIYVIWSLWEVDGRFVWSWPAVSTHPPIPSSAVPSDASTPLLPFHSHSYHSQHFYCIFLHSDHISSFCTTVQCWTLLWRWLHSLAACCEYGKLHKHLIYLSFPILNI